MIDLSTKVQYCENFNEDPDLLVAAETTTKSHKRKQEVERLELEPAPLEWFLYERDEIIMVEPIREKARLLYTPMYPTNEIPALRFSNGIRGFNHHGSTLFRPYPILRLRAIQHPPWTLSLP